MPGIRRCIVPPVSLCRALFQAYHAAGRHVHLQVRRALGRKLSAVLSAVLVIYQFGSCAAYLIIVGDSFVPLIGKVAEPGSWLADRRVIITFFALVVILPLCLPRCAASIPLQLWAASLMLRLSARPTCRL